MQILKEELLNEIKEVESSMKELYARGTLSEVRHNEFTRLMGNLRVFLGVEDEQRK